MTLAIVTASTNVERARPCLESWVRCATTPPPIFIVLNGCANVSKVEVAGVQAAWIHRDAYLGTVPAFRRGIDLALASGDFGILAALHDDFEIKEPGWDEKVLRYFARNPAMGLAGFGGATGLGDLDLYEKPYDPMSLARVGFRSDLEDAEAHGMRSLLAEKVAVLDGFSQCGRREFWEGYPAPSTPHDQRFEHSPYARPWTVLEGLGIHHHAYDAGLGALAARYGWECWYLPLRCRHYGGQTAVGDVGYQAWAKTQDVNGDQGFWQRAHAAIYEAFRDQLPLRT